MTLTGLINKHVVLKPRAPVTRANSSHEIHCMRHSDNPGVSSSGNATSHLKIRHVGKSATQEATRETLSHATRRVQRIACVTGPLNPNVPKQNPIYHNVGVIQTIFWEIKLRHRYSLYTCLLRLWLHQLTVHSHELSNFWNLVAQSGNLLFDIFNFLLPGKCWWLPELYW